MTEVLLAPLRDLGFCPLCGQPLRLPSAAEPGHARCTACGYVHWENPLPAAGVLVVRNGRLLLIRHAEAARGGGEWAFPGGFVEAGETAEEAALREAREQAGIEATITGIVGRPHSIRQPSQLVLVFRGEADGAPQPGHEVSETRWFSPDEIPWDEIAFPSSATALRDLIAEGLGAPAHPWTPSLGDFSTARPAPRPFCRACGSPVRLAGSGEDSHGRCTACDTPAWRRPATGVGMFVVRDGRVLLARRDARHSRGAGLWTGPGGHIEAGETAEEAIVREMREEVDLHVTVTGITGVYSERDPAVVHVSYLGEAEGEPRAAHETAEVRWFAPPEIPWAELFADGIQPMRDLLARGLRSG